MTLLSTAEDRDLTSVSSTFRKISLGRFRELTTGLARTCCLNVDWSTGSGFVECEIRRQAKASRLKDYKLSKLCYVFKSWVNTFTILFKTYGLNRFPEIDVMFEFRALWVSAS